MLEPHVATPFDKASKADAAPLSRKQLAIREREKELMAIAREVVEREGFAHLTMDKIAAASDYSKGTVYNHFSSKEDLIAALAIEAVLKEITFFQRAFNFEGTSRDKVVAMHAGYHIFSQLEPVMSMCAIVSRTSAVKEKASTARLAKLEEMEAKMVALGEAFLQDGIQKGELVLPDERVAHSIVFANWAMAFGTNVLLNNAPESQCVSRLVRTDSALVNVNFLLDGMGWLPLSSDVDYRAVWHRAETTLFANEIALLNPS
ncbi:Bacterial regulatory proteins, tetR family [Grimontia marina]|uniref:Bacterial regulatory proteins, tetR family n=2 Tax=Grimontia marina TaxID=646534 RepID=A0A128FBU4_9GAMM|nr:Bacterial regulatory proteins, tetR family [Grimontia marina]